MSSRFWRSASIAAAFSLLAGFALAELRVDFAEGAPKDRFSIQNAGACPLAAFELEIDLSGSAGGLIFDTAAAGPGVQVYQPFELASGAERVVEIAPLADGDRRLTLKLSGLDPAERVVFTIDVDDTLGVSPTRVAGAEIEGAGIRIDGAAAARFNAEAVAAAETPCSPTS